MFITWENQHTPESRNYNIVREIDLGTLKIP